MEYIHRHCLYKYFPNKFCSICQSDFQTYIYVIYDTIKHILFQLLILNFQYHLLINLFITKICVFCFVLIETIIVYIKIYKISLIFKNNVLLLCLSYQSLKTILIMYIIYICNTSFCYDIFSFILYIQLNLLLYLYLYNKGNVVHINY
jgi:hypothetical protein